MRSHLLEGVVRHRRVRPFAYALEHEVFYVALDLDELDEVPRRHPVDQPRALEPAVVPRRRSPRPAGKRRLRAAHPRPPARRRRGPGRLAGHARDQPARPRLRLQPGQLLPVPGSGRRPAGGHRRGPQHPRRAPPLQPPRARRTRSGASCDSMDKAFYVSPFIEMAGRYTVRVRDEASRLRITINEDPGDGLLLHTSLDLARRRLTDRMVLRMLVRYPFVTHKTIGMIHWHALRLWLRGAPIPSTQRGDTMSQSMTVGRLPRLADSILSRVAWRIAVAAAESGHGRAARRRPARRRRDGRSVGRPGPSRLPRSTSTTGARSSSCSSTARPAAARRTWTACGPARTWPACCAGRRSTASRLSLSAGWFRRPGAASSDDRAPPASQHEAPEPSQHLGPLRPRQRLLPDVPRRDDDLLERGLRVARPVARRRAAQQVPAHGRGRRARPRPARPRDRDGLGRVRPVCGGRARLPGDADHDLAGAVRPGPRARAGRRAGAPRRRPAPRLPRHHGTYDAIVSIEMLEAVGAEYFATFFEVCDRGARPGGPAQPPVDHLPGRRLRAAAPRRELDPDVHLPGRPVPVAGRHRAVDARHSLLIAERDRHRRATTS